MKREAVPKGQVQDEVTKMEKHEMGMQCCFWGLRWHNKLMQQRDENGKKERRENRDRTKARQLYFCVCECELNKPTSNIEKFPCVQNEHCMFRLAEQLILHNFA